jgi:hypothetical protein
MDEHHLTAFGRVALAGKVIEGTEGYRASHGRPERLWVPNVQWRLTKLLGDAYGVSVGRANPFADEWKEKWR